jgi:hypothetical protein
MAGILEETGAVHLSGNPFLLDTIGSIKYIILSKIEKTTILRRKYPHNKLLESFITSLNGCYFQGSNDSTFANSKTLWMIENLTSLIPLQKKT